MSRQNNSDMNILLVSFFSPLEPNSGSGLRSNSLLKNLAELGCSIHLFAFSQAMNSDRKTEHTNIARSCFVTRTPRSKLGALLRSYFLLQPLAISNYFSKNVIESFVRFTSGQTYDAVIFDHLCASELRKYLPLSGSRTVVYEHNAEYAMSREFCKNRKTLHQIIILFLDYFLVKRFEFSALRSADCVVHVSNDDMRNYSADIQSKSVVIPNTLPYKIEFTVKNTLENNVVFVGSMVHYANVEGILRFIMEAWIEIHNLRHNINLLIVGGNPPAQIQKYNGKYNISVLGYVPDISDIYKKSLLAIAPIFTGSGSRLKILEAMMHSTLNVASPKGAEGLPAENGKHIVIASDMHAWVKTILHYVDNKEERALIEHNAYRFVVDRYYYANYKQVIKDCLIGRRLS